MNFVDAITSCFLKYIVFSGRASRSEYWYFFLLNLILAIITALIDHLLLMPHDADPSQAGPLGALVTLALIIPGLAVASRRLHDIDKSFWWVLLAFIPLVGIIVLIIWYCRRGTIGDNRFGPDPLGGVG